MFWFWLVLVVLALACEGITTALVSIWFVPGALVGMLLSALNIAIWVQALVFLALSIALIYSFQRFFKDKLGKNDKSKATNLDLVLAAWPL